MTEVDDDSGVSGRISKRANVQQMKRMHLARAQVEQFRRKHAVRPSEHPVRLEMAVPLSARAPVPPSDALTFGVRAAA
jgi:hypothetical protein